MFFKFFVSRLAAHCITDEETTSKWALTHVRLGEWDTSKDKDCEDGYNEEIVCSQPPVDITIEQKIPHEHFDKNSVDKHNDIALLRLSKEVAFSSFIKPICLPTEQGSASDLLVNKTLEVAGWGMLSIFCSSSILILLLFRHFQQNCDLFD